ncbi:unnamed protein product (macronuclear) [Paramecium tetraurelia]|uniref:Dynein heavy chain coiled coil stalk domain-containing protein n=1 Tax=Paramecium tetraurelia TaxID=5888 RepID=A0BN41_PARTE|nr:uncharacterized protein GSPATT00030596001 [Paramecium tetraurelia]CAK59958.1 unnamed protein product [Paramecium tetraurelia]|eukprot:XP_001427356.1 hypothetical protein (macronuclear) [Paramecium tetraurelia strain d4-2]
MFNEAQYAILGKTRNIKQILQFRLVSRRAKETVKLLLPKQINNLQQLIDEQQNDIQIKIQSAQQAGNDQDQRQGLQAALDGISLLSRAHFVELRCQAKPHELIEKIINLVCLALDPAFKVAKDNWKECIKYLGQQSFIELILNFNISSLNNKQLQQLEQVNNITEQQVASKSLVASSLLIFLKAVVELRQSKLYMTQNEIKELESKIKKEQKLIDKIEKIHNQ